MATVFGRNLVTLPSIPAAPASIVYRMNDVVGATASAFTGQQQIQDWQQAYFEATATYPPMQDADAQEWIGFLAALRGIAGVFQLGDPLRTTPRGSASGTPLVNGANQTGFSLLIKGFTANATGVLKAGDWIQVGYRAYRMQAALNADVSGHATASIWPNLRESPGDGDAIVTSGVKALWCLKANQRSWSIDDMRTYGFQLDLREAI